ncbi:MAG: hypothetical protein ABWY12_12140 [Burkholderiales bacterium]
MNGNGFGLTLANEVQIWSRDQWRTPNATMADHGPMDPAYRAAKGQTISLDDQVSTWASPCARDYRGSGPTTVRQDGKSRMDMLDYQAEQGFHSLHLGQPTQDGQTSSALRRRLNPLFVEWLMGWPEGLSGFDTAEMASCRSPQPSPGCGCMDCWLTKQREMLSDLLTITPPAQGSLL